MTKSECKTYSWRNSTESSLAVRFALCTGDSTKISVHLKNQMKSKNIANDTDPRLRSYYKLSLSTFLVTCIAISTAPKSCQRWWTGFLNIRTTLQQKIPKITVWSIFKHHWKLIYRVFAKIPADRLSSLVLKQFSSNNRKAGYLIVSKYRLCLSEWDEGRSIPLDNEKRTPLLRHWV